MKGCHGTGAKGDTGAQPDPRAFVLAVKVQLPGHTEYLQVLETEMLNEAWTSWEIRQSDRPSLLVRHLHSKVRLSLAV